jgi:putative endonuclease
MANDRNGTIYTGVTSDLIKRVYQHKNNEVKGFTEKYNVHLLVYYEEVGDMMAAIQREKNIKKYPRKWKLNLIEQNNPEWRDLYKDLL